MVTVSLISFQIRTLLTLNLTVQWTLKSVKVFPSIHVSKKNRKKKNNNKKQKQKQNKKQKKPTPVILPCSEELLIELIENKL